MGKTDNENAAASGLLKYFFRWYVVLAILLTINIALDLWIIEMLRNMIDRLDVLQHP